MTYTLITPQAFLADVPPFDQLSSVALERLRKHVRVYRYRIGQPIVVRDKLPSQISILYQGQARLLGYDPTTQQPITLQRLEPGAILGWVGHVRGIACETAIASTEAVCLTLPADVFLALLEQNASLRRYFDRTAALSEVSDVVGAELQHRADRERVLRSADVIDLKEFVLKAHSQANVMVTNDMQLLEQSFDADWLWLISGGQGVNLAIPSEFGAVRIGQPFDPSSWNQNWPSVRLLGLPAALFSSEMSDSDLALQASPFLDAEIPYAPEEPPELVQTTRAPERRYPFVRGRGELESALACFQMLSRYLNLPFRRDVIRRVLLNQQERTGAISLMHCGAVAELMGLRAQLVKVPVSAIGRLPVPAMVHWHNHLALLYEINPQKAVIAAPEVGMLRCKPEDLATQNQAEIPHGEDAASVELISEWTPNTVSVLLLQPTQETPQQRFGLSWFLPSLHKYKHILLEVFVASFFVQLFGLANPLVTQVIIDKVLVQNSPNTLQVLGLLLLVVAVFEAILTSLRTYLFVDTTNRIDLALGSDIINHLLRLPLRYFERRPVGELATRVNELENIRQFLTGTALTVVLDAVFSVIYIIVMIIYSWQLTLVALATLPLFIFLTAMASPIIRRQLRSKAERNAETQSYLVEVLSGIQTVKAQNIELRSRWQWQERYARYVSAGFKTVLTYTTASSTSMFLNQLSGLLVLWVGAYLVLAGQLTLGQLIAFRIIAGYVTSPLLRLTQLWQNFQETALSLERLSDIVDTPQEADAANQGNIPMPTIQGTVKYEQLSFRFNPNGPLQLNQINLEFPSGLFVGIVGQSGSGKSTLMKLLPRLYPLECGRILIDGYDISKVELYSLRRQIGIVPQDTLLFQGSVQDNIALNYPDATAEDIIEAARIAAAHDFIMELPNGYNTFVGERGAALSGGQRQRIAIARMVLQSPRLLVLDEATSALDYDSERQVCLNLADAFQGRTVFFITHRLSTIRNADRIVVLDQGSVVEQGTHEELMALKGRYYCLYQQQEAQR